MRLRDYRLALFLITILGVYHFINWKSGSFSTLISRVEWQQKGVLWVPSFKVGSENAFDQSSEWLKGMGYWIRFRMGQLNAMAARGPSEPYLYLYDRRNNPFQYESLRSEIDERFTKKMKRVFDHLNTHGIEMIVAPLPPKQSLDRQKLGTRLPPDHLFSSHAIEPIQLKVREDPRGNLDAMLAADPSRIVDLFRVMQQYKEEHPKDELFIPWDLHWSSLGIAVTAQAVLQQLKGLGWKVPETRLRFCDLAPLKHNDQLLQGLFIPKFLLESRPSFSWREPFYDLEVLKPISASNQRLIVIGDSNSERLRDTDYRFSRILSAVLRRELVEYSLAGTSHIWLSTKLRTAGIKLRKSDLVIYQALLPVLYEGETEFSLPDIEDNSLI